MTGLPFCEGLGPPLVNALLAAHLCKLSLFSLAMDVTALFMYHISLRKYTGTDLKYHRRKIGFWVCLILFLLWWRYLTKSRYRIKKKYPQRLTSVNFLFPSFFWDWTRLLFIVGEDETWTCSPEWATQFRLGPWTSNVDQVHTPPAI